MQEIVGVISSKIIKVTNNEATNVFVGSSIMRQRDRKTGESIYQIANTSYYMSQDEFDFFKSNGAVKIPEHKTSTISQKKKSVSKVSSINRTETVYGNKSSKEMPALAATSKPKTNNISNSKPTSSVASNRAALMSTGQLQAITGAKIHSDVKNRISSSSTINNNNAHKKSSSKQTTADNIPVLAATEKTNKEEEIFESESLMPDRSLLENSDFFKDYNPHFDMGINKDSRFAILNEFKENIHDKLDNAFDKIGYTIKEKLIAFFEKERISIDQTKNSAQL